MGSISELVKPALRDPGLRRQELGAQAIGLLDTLIGDPDAPEYLRTVAREIVAAWDQTIPPKSAA